VPEVCVLDPDGDLVTYLKREEKAEKMTAGPATIPTSTVIN
jgi:hypothetical protein